MEAERSAEAPQSPHPLDPMLPQEIERSVRILKEGLAKSNVDPDQLRFVRCSVVEPTKQQLASGEVSAEDGFLGSLFVRWKDLRVGLRGVEGSSRRGNCGNTIET